jgi:5-methylcytosine-specific restriction endonuclease McrA
MPRKKKLVTKQGGKLEENKKAAATKRKTKKLAPRPFGCGTLTEAGRHAKIVGYLRSGSKWWKPKMETLRLARVGTRVNKATGRMAMHHKCKICKEDFPSKEVQVDHITPLVGAEGFKTWDEFIGILFCEKEGMQVLCKPCHQIKTNIEKAARAAYKKELKDNEMEKQSKNKTH